MVHLPFPTSNAQTQSNATTSALKTNTKTNESNQQTLVKRPPLDVYKKIPIIRKPTDSVTYEDSEGNLRSIVTKDLFNDALKKDDTSTAATTQKVNIPTPELTQLSNYNIDNSFDNNYIMPECYIRHKKNRTFAAYKNSSPALTEIELKHIDYNLDMQDEKFIKEYNTKQDDEGICNNELDKNTLELMIDVLEKATKFEGVMSQAECKELLNTYVPHILPFSENLVSSVYNYWINKRSSLKKPLLRQYWPITSNADTNPHAVFRLRNDNIKEKYKLRKKRVLNDIESYRKMILLKRDFETMKSMLEYVLRREKLMECRLNLQEEWLKQKKYECFDTSGLPRLCNNVNMDEIDKLLTLPKANFSSTAVAKSKKKKKRRLIVSSSSNAVDASSVISNESDMTNLTDTNRNETKDNKQAIIPNYMQYLPSRETFETNWDHATPHQSNYTHGEESSTYRFRHRPRLGRGGRVVIDRLPIQTHHNVFIAGESIYHNSLKKEKQKNVGLLDLISPPVYSDVEGVQNKIEDIGYMLDDDDDDSVVGKKEEENGQVVMVKVDDWMNAEDGHWGEEKMVFGPL